MTDYYMENKALLDILADKAYMDEVHGLKTLVKPVPDPQEGTAMDPRAWAYRKADAEKPNSLAEYVEIPVSLVRDEPAYPAKDLTTIVVSKEERTITTRNGETPIIIYRPEGGEEEKPVMLFFHGGAFIAGCTQVVEPFCKLLAEKADMTVIGVEYRLAPEHRFPAGLHDCYDAFEWVYAYASSIHVDPSRIYVGGDSAGATFAIGCCLMERDAIENGEISDELIDYLAKRSGQKKGRCGRIAYEALIYPGVIVNNIKTDDFRWKLRDYEIAEDDEIAMNSAVSLKAMTGEMAVWYMGTDARITNPLAAPLCQESLTGLPKTLTVVVEFDYLRLSGEAFARKLARDGVMNRNILYKGMDHSFIDRVGDCPQAYDLVKEIVKDIRG